MHRYRKSRFTDERPIELIKDPLQQDGNAVPAQVEDKEFEQKRNDIQSKVRKNSFSQASHPPEIGGIALHVVWDVDANAAYDVPGWLSRMTSAELRHQGGTGMIALRTYEGLGRIYLNSGKVIETDPASLLIMEWAQLQRYHCVGSIWRFWWFEFSLLGPRHFPLNQLLHAPIYAEDEREFQELFLILRRHSVSQARLASAYFTKLLYHWIASWEETYRETPQRKQMLRIIELMHEKTAQNWAVEEMAQAAHMSERNFRRAFEAETGQTPKAFYDRLRLSIADELLRQKVYNITELAFHLGFSSASHFSKAYLHHFGVAPSRRIGDTQET